MGERRPVYLPTSSIFPGPMSSDKKKKKDELTELNQLKEGDKINVIGVVYTADDPFQTRG